MPFWPGARTLACVPAPLMVIALVMVTVPNPPGSSTSISPPAAVFDMAPANVLHGAVRLHGLTSSPVPETQVRVAWANTSGTPDASIGLSTRAATASILIDRGTRLIQARRRGFK